MDDNMKKWLPWIAVAAVALIVIIVIAVNSGSDDEASSTTVSAAPGATTTSSAETATTAAQETTTTASGGETPEPGPLGAVELAAGEDIQIRSLQAITGPVAFLGIPNQRGVEIAIENFGAVKGHSVTIGTGMDDLCSAEGGQAAGQAIAADDKIIGTIGTSCSSAATAALPLISDAGQVLISSSNTAPPLTSDLQGTAGTDWRPGYYRTAHNDLFQGTAVAEFVATELGLTKIATIHDGSVYAEGLVSAFEASFVNDYGGTITLSTAVNVGDIDMIPVLTDVASSDPEGLFYPIFMPEGGFIATDSKKVDGFDSITMIGADGILADNFMEIPETKDTYLSGPNLAYGTNTSETGVDAEGFLEQYEALYGEAPSAPFWAHSYDATVLLLSAIDAVAVELPDGGLFIDRQMLRDELVATTNFAGIIGSLSCDQYGDCGAQRISVIQNITPDDLPSSIANVLFEWQP
jgi:branched-chain amino acid transport system substrate-binding protein